MKQNLKKIIIITLAILLTVGMNINNFSLAVGTPDTKVGIWYNTWYAKTITQRWTQGHGSGSANQLMGDVDGDGKDDAVAFFSNGDWYVALSTGSTFGGNTRWTQGHGSGSVSQFLADVNGDGKADAVVFFSNGDWYVALSTGSAFGGYTRWTQGHGSGSVKQLMGDVTGDGKADAIVFFSNGDWYVAPSTGTAFGGATRWAQGHGSGSANQLLGDVTGDGKADAIAFFSVAGSWYVAASTGSAFGGASQWKTGFGAGSPSQMLGDTGDNRLDAAFFQLGNWYVSESSGSAFTNSIQLQGSFRGGYVDGSTKQFWANPQGLANGERQACAFLSSGEWHVRRNGFNQYNTWEAWNISYVPYTQGAYNTYDSGDTAVIDEHLAMMADAQIDFLLFDATNSIYTDGGYIFDRAKAVAARIRVWNSNANNRKVKYALATGAIQYDSNPATLEYEAGEVWSQFVNTVDGGTDNYFYKDGKPLIVNYCSQTQEDTWNSYGGSKTNSNRFTCEWAHSGSSRHAGIYGWENRSDGSIDDNEVMVVMPGWNNHQGDTPVSRANGGYYQTYGWDKVIKKSPRPEYVMISAFNDYGEDTAIAPTDTQYLDDSHEKWYNGNDQLDSFMYWNMTKDYIKQMKGYTASVDFSSTQGTYQWYYQQWNGSTYSDMTWDTGSGRWKGSSTYCLIMNSSQHPDGNDSVRKWVAPSTGTVRVKGNAHKASSGGDGVTVKIMKNGTTVWGPYDIPYNDLIGISHNFDVAVSAGDAIYFIVSQKSSIDSDTTNWDPSIYY